MNERAEIARSDKHTPFFHQFLELMEEAYGILTEEAFGRLESRIKQEIVRGWRGKDE